MKVMPDMGNENMQQTQ